MGGVVEGVVEGVVGGVVEGVVGGVVGGVWICECVSSQVHFFNQNIPIFNMDWISALNIDFLRLEKAKRLDLKKKATFGGEIFLQRKEKRGKKTQKNIKPPPAFCLRFDIASVCTFVWSCNEEKRISDMPRWRLDTSHVEREIRTVAYSSAPRYSVFVGSYNDPWTTNPRAKMGFEKSIRDCPQITSASNISTPIPLPLDWRHFWMTPYPLTHVIFGWLLIPWLT